MAEALEEQEAPALAAVVVAEEAAAEEAAEAEAEVPEPVVSALEQGQEVGRTE